MKRKLNGHIYDTATAKAVAEYKEGNASTLSYLQETLYKKKNGEFFLHGIGWANTCYRQKVNGWWRVGEKIIPLSHRDVEDWCREHLDAKQFLMVLGNE